MLVNELPTWEMLMLDKIGDEYNYKSITIKRLKNYKVKVSYKRNNNNIEIICFLKE